LPLSQNPSNVQIPSLEIISADFKLQNFNMLD